MFKLWSFKKIELLLSFNMFELFYLKIFEFFEGRSSLSASNSSKIIWESSYLLLKRKIFEFLFYHESISWVERLSFLSSFFFLPFFFSSLTLSAYLRVLRVCSAETTDGEIFPIMTDLQLPMKESLRIKVSLLPLKGKCFLS